MLGEQNIVDYIASNEFKEQKLPLQTAMCDNFQGFCNFCWAEFCWAEFGIDPVLCKPHATGKPLCCACLLFLFLILSPAGTASQYSHVPTNEYYNFVVDICDIGVEASRPVLRLCWLTTSASTMGLGLPIGVICFGRRHRDECVLPIVGMLDATTTWGSKFPGATSRSFYVQTAHWGFATSLPPHQDRSRKGAYATPQCSRLLQCIHP